jgi:iron complex outermembrane receptor protein
MRPRVSRTSSIVAALLMAGPPLIAQVTSSDDLTRLSIEQLMDIDVTSAARRRESLAQAATALYVITGDEIRRSGATSIAEALRMAPGLDVARVTSNEWAISARGFNGRFANKLLILVDGRTVYTPLFSGVYWDTLDTFLPDIDRIEVIRGPGAALWGANAVNGVINIITRPAEETTGGMARVAAGDEERLLGSLRYGNAVRGGGHYRVFAKYVDRDAAHVSTGSASDPWHVGRAGFRADFRHGRDSFTAQGDGYDGLVNGRVATALLVPPFEEVLHDPLDACGGDLLARWTRTLSTDSDLSLQAYYDGYRRDSVVLLETRHTLDLDFQHHFRWGQRQQLVWGLGFRYSTDDEEGSFTVSFDPERRSNSLPSAFVQDEVMLADRLRLTAGTRIERDPFTDVEVQPTLRLLYTPSARHSLWAAVSRAVRTPSRAEEDVRAVVAAQPGTLIAAFGTASLQAERLTALELGYRAQPTRLLSVDIALFRNHYDRLRSVSPSDPFAETSPAPPHVVVPLYGTSSRTGRTYGIEVAVDWSIGTRVKTRSSYSFLHMNLDQEALPDSTLGADAGQNPQHQLHTLALLDIGHGWHVSGAVHYVSGLPQLQVPAYCRIDGRLQWQPSRRWELAAVVQNAGQAHHAEFGPSVLVQSAEIERAAFAEVSLRF